MREQQKKHVEQDNSSPQGQINLVLSDDDEEPSIVKTEVVSSPTTKKITSQYDESLPSSVVKDLSEGKHVGLALLLNKKETLAKIQSTVHTQSVANDAIVENERRKVQKRLAKAKEEKEQKDKKKESKRKSTHKSKNTNKKQRKEKKMWVKHILGVKVCKGQTQYLVEWDSDDPEYNNQKPEYCVWPNLDENLILEYNVRLLKVGDRVGKSNDPNGPVIECVWENDGGCRSRRFEHIAMLVKLGIYDDQAGIILCK